MAPPSHSKREHALLRWIFIIGMLAFCFFIAWHCWVRADLLFQKEDVSKSLETSRQREVKQQYEYDRAFAAIPLVEEELTIYQPQAEAMLQEVDDLRTQRNACRTANAQLTEELTAMQGEIEQTSAALAKAEEDRSALEAQMASLQEARTALETEIASLRHELEALTHTLP